MVFFFSFFPVFLCFEFMFLLFFHFWYLLQECFRASFPAQFEKKKKETVLLMKKMPLYVCVVYNILFKKKEKEKESTISLLEVRIQPKIITSPGCLEMLL